MHASATRQPNAAAEPEAHDRRQRVAEVAADAMRRVRVPEAPRRDVRVEDREVGGMEHAVADAHQRDDREQPARRPARATPATRAAGEQRQAAEQHRPRADAVDGEAGDELGDAARRRRTRRPARRAASTRRRTRRAAAETAAAARAGRSATARARRRRAPMTRASRRNDSAACGIQGERRRCKVDGGASSTLYRTAVACLAARGSHNASSEERCMIDKVASPTPNGRRS